MEDFRIIYRLLQAIIAYEKAEERTLDFFLPERLKTSAENRDRLLVKLVRAGYVDGVRVADDINNLTQPVVLWSASAPSITIRGMEYLEENSMMRKAAAVARGIRDILPI